MMMWKVKLRLLIDRITNLLPKKKKAVVKPDFQHLLYAQRKTEPKKSLGSHAIAFLLPVVRECGMVIWGDLKWVMTRRRQSSEDAWAEAVERMGIGK
jgi:hypothetical protein